jgi:phosphoglycolate phosphatase-like HAD superfamily hydrolase
MLGDTPYDIEAAGAAAVEAIGLRCGGWPASALRGAIAIYDSAADLFARYDTSPFSRLT